MLKRLLETFRTLGLKKSEYKVSQYFWDYSFTERSRSEVLHWILSFSYFILLDNRLEKFAITVKTL